MLYILLLLIQSCYALQTDWVCMHEASVNNMKDIVNEYAVSFPCEDCREHFNNLLDTHCFPLEYVQTDEEAKIWSWLTHNIVNKRIGKKWQPFSIMDNYRD